MLACSFLLLLLRPAAVFGVSSPSPAGTLSSASSTSPAPAPALSSAAAGSSPVLGAGTAVEKYNLGAMPASFDMCETNSSVFGGDAIGMLGKLNFDVMKSSGANVNQMRDFLQGYRGEWDQNQFKDPLKIDFVGYTTGLVAFVAPGLVLAGLALLCCLPFTLGRFFRDCGHLTPCCSCDDALGTCLIKTSCGCCCYKPAEDGYSCCEKATPCVTYMIFGLAAVAVSSVAIAQVGAFSNGLTSLVCDTDRIRVEASAYMDGIYQPMASVSNNATAIIRDVDASMKVTSALGAALVAIDADVSAFEVIAKIVANTDVQDQDGVLLTSTAIRDARLAAVRFHVSMGDAKNIAAVLDGTKEQFSTLLTSVQAGIEAASLAVTSANTMAKNFLDGEFKSVVETLKEYFAPLRFYTYPGAAAALAFVLVPFLFVCIGWFFASCGKYTNCTGVKCIDESDDKIGQCCLGGASCITFLGMMVAFIVGGVGLPLAVVSSDICVVLETIPNELDDYITIGGSAAATNGSSAPKLGGRQLLQRGGGVGGGGGGEWGGVFGGEQQGDFGDFGDNAGHHGYDITSVGGGGQGGGRGGVRRSLSSTYVTRRFGSPVPDMAPLESTGHARMDAAIARLPRRVRSMLATRLRVASRSLSISSSMSSINPATMIGTCFTNSSLAVALNLTTVFPFTKLDFGAFDVVAKTPTSWAEYDTMNSEITGLTVQSFGYDEVKMTAAIVAAEANANATTGDDKKAADARVVELKAVKPTLEGQIKSLQDPMAAIDAKVKTVQGHTNELIEALKYSKEKVNPLLVSANEIISASTCGFVKTIYDGM